MPTVDATVGGAAANSYVSTAAATAFLDTRLYTEPWLEADSTSQAQSLIWATQLLDTQVRWYGTPTTLTQALAWPMTGQRDHLGRLVPNDVIPAAIKQATALYALALLRDDTEAPGTVDIGGVKSRTIGDMTITYHDQRQETTTQARPVSQGIPAEVRALLTPYAQMAGGLTVRLLRT
jgi:hypothetical protein